MITEQFGKFKETIELLIHTLGQLHDDKEIQGDALGKMLDIIGNINHYLYKRYYEYNQIEEEVDDMIKTYFDPKVWEDGVAEGIERGIERGIEQGTEKMIYKMLTNGVAVEEISRMTGTPIEQVRKVEEMID